MTMWTVDFLRAWVYFPRSVAIPVPEIDMAQAVIATLTVIGVVAAAISGHRVDRLLHEHFKFAQALPADLFAWLGLAVGVVTAWAGWA